MNIIEETLKKLIFDAQTNFVFNTDIAANSWTDFIARKGGQDGWPASIELSRFLAWDAFKGQALKSKQENLSAVPALLRKLFARSLLERIKRGENFFERLINFEYKENALSFTDWLAGLLPSLGRWRALAEKFIAGGKLAGERNNAENRDFLRLYNEYADFLKKRNLFEPAWQDSRFDGGEKKYVVFFPELLDDFDEYKEVLLQAEKDGSVSLVSIPQKKGEIRADYWASTRLELRMTALKILRQNEAGTDWNDIALCVPDIENLRPYVERELELYQIPFWTRSGIKLGKTGAGRVFRKIQECAQNAFSYQSVRSLVLDANIPWKAPDEMEILVRLGKESKCLVQYTDEKGKTVDPWLLDLSEGQSKGGESQEFLDAKKFYKRLKDSAKKLADSKSFSAIKANWKKFEEEFILPKEETSEEANNILSRCVALLDELSELEEEYPETVSERAASYSFFLNEIENVQYQPKQKKRGVSVFDYKVSAQAAIKKTFAINASQEKVTVEKMPLNFLSQKERAELFKGRESELECDHSEAYIRSYALCSDTSFSASQKALDGYAVPHSALVANEKPLAADPELDAKDFIKREKDFLADNGKDAPSQLTQAQKRSFENYFSRAKGNDEAQKGAASDFDKTPKEWLKAAIDKKTKEGRSGLDGKKDKIHITATELGDFYPCPRKWILKDLLRVNEFSLDTDLFENYDQGSVNHKILELYFESLKQKGQALPLTDEESGKIAPDGNFDYEEKNLFPLLEKNSREAFSRAKAYDKSALVQEALKSQDKIFARELIKFLREFCKEENFGGWNIVETEWGKGMDVDLPPILQGRMDLVLRSPFGETAIIDYKNSKWAIPKGDLNLKKGEGELEDCQMAAYVRLWESANPGQKVLRASFVPIKKFEETAVIKEGSTSKNKSICRADFEPALKSLERLALGMEKSLEKRLFSQEEVKPFKDCAGCSYNSICRTAY